MKPQDLLFIVVLLVLIFLRKSTFPTYLGLLLLLLAVPLFTLHVFFTAERLVMYAAACFLIGILFLMKERSSKMK